MIIAWRRKKKQTRFISSGESKFDSKELANTCSFNSRACSAKKCNVGNQK